MWRSSLSSVPEGAHDNSPAPSVLGINIVIRFLSPGGTAGVGRRQGVHSSLWDCGGDNAVTVPALKVLGYSRAVPHGTKACKRMHNPVQGRGPNEHGRREVAQAQCDSPLHGSQRRVEMLRGTRYSPNLSPKGEGFSKHTLNGNMWLLRRILPCWLATTTVIYM
jgi:hypothetical protein